MESLIKHGSDLEAKTKDECSPLHLASKNGQLDVMESLIKQGSNIESKTKDEETLLTNPSIWQLENPPFINTNSD